jgi:hypothetical protein
MIDFTSLDITGYGGRPVPHTFMKQKEETDHLAILLPGVGYTVHMPLLYYPMLALLQVGADVLRVETMYVKEPEFGELAAAEKARWVFTDAAAACQAALKARHYRRKTLVGKSLGTLAMGYLMTSIAALGGADTIWLTPLLWNESLYAQIQQTQPRSLFVAGTGDPHFQADRLDDLTEATGGSAVVIEGANHSLEFEGDVARSFEAMQSVVEAVVTFLEAGFGRDR